MKRTFRQILIAVSLVILATGCAGKKPKGGGGDGDGPGPGGGGGGGGKSRQPQSLSDVLGQNDEIARLKDERSELQRQLDQVFGANGLNNNQNGFNTGVNPDNFVAGPSAAGAPGAGVITPGGGVGIAPALAGDLGSVGGNPATGGGSKGGVVDVGFIPGTDPNAGFTASASRSPASTSAATDTTHAVVP